MRNINKTVIHHFEPVNKYYEKFRKHIFTLLFIGYSRVREQRNDLSDSMEDDITDRIVCGIKTYLGDRMSPDWVDCFQVEQQRPYSPHGEIGDRRKWLDLFFQGNRKKENLNFCFETKRLNEITRKEDYFGNKGMQRFLSGIYPINTYREAAMIGYMQSQCVCHWKKWLKNNSISNFESYSVIPELESTFCTCHEKQSGKCVILFHVLLDFLPLR